MCISGDGAELSRWAFAPSPRYGGYRELEAVNTPDLPPGERFLPTFLEVADALDRGSSINLRRSVGAPDTDPSRASSRRPGCTRNRPACGWCLVSLSRPALLGGTPVRTTPFQSRPLIDERDVEAVAQTVRDGVLSRFVGSPLPGTRELLLRTSAQLALLDASFSFVGGPNVRQFSKRIGPLHMRCHMPSR